MLNKNANYYNIEKNFKYNSVISTFSEHIIIYRTLSIHIWQLKCQQIQTNKTKNPILSGNFSEFFNFSSSAFWEKPLWNQKLLLLTTIARRSGHALARPFPTLSYFPFFSESFLELIFATNKNNVVETISCFV